MCTVYQEVHKKELMLTEELLTALGIKYCSSQGQFTCAFLLSFYLAFIPVAFITGRSNIVQIYYYSYYYYYCGY